MTAKTFDPKCWDLACHFLDDVPGSTEADRRQLAEDIQEVIEDTISNLECCPTCGACPGFIGAECDETCDHATSQPPFLPLSARGE